MCERVDERMGQREKQRASSQIGSDRARQACRFTWSRKNCIRTPAHCSAFHGTV